MASTPGPPVDKTAVEFNGTSNPAATPADSTTSTAPTPASAIPPTITTTTTADSVKQEDSPAPPSRLASTDAETPIPENGNATHSTSLTPSNTTAGRKRKQNSLSARGVANLTPDQLAKKRANDRQAQRAIRERTKTHIDALEQQVRDLSSQKPILDLQAAVRGNNAAQAELRELKGKLKAVMDIVQPAFGREDAARNGPVPVPVSTPAPPSNIIQAQQPPQLTSNTPPFAGNSRFTPNSQRSAEQSYPESLASLGTPSPTHSAGGATRRSSIDGAASFRMALDYQRHNLTHGLDFGTDERLGFNFLVDGSYSVPKVDSVHRRSSENCRSSNPPSMATYTPVLNGSITGTSVIDQQTQSPPAYLTPIRNVPATCTLDAILLDFLHNRQQEAAQGVPKQSLIGPPYPSVSSLLNPEKSVYSHPVSKVFTDILLIFPNICTLPEQVGVLYVMFLLMRWQIYPTPENYDRLPDWLTPRPSQLLTPHPAWLDYLPWPRMRDRLVMAHAEYPFEHWFLPFTETLSVNWPYEATDCLLSTNECDDLLINPVFERHMRNLGNWSLGPAFAEAFPAMAETARIKEHGS